MRGNDMTNTEISLARMKAWEDATSTLRHAVHRASEAEKPGLRYALALIDNERLIATEHHDGHCVSAARGARAR